MQPALVECITFNPGNSKQTKKIKQLEALVHGHPAADLLEEPCSSPHCNDGKDAAIGKRGSAGAVEMLPLRPA